MSGYPYDTGSSFVRDPGRYVHDTFGHTGDDDAGIRPACFRRIPHTGIDVSPKRQGDTGAPVVSPVNGTIVETGVDADAGLYHIIEQAGGGLYWIGGHHSRFEKRSGVVERGETIARMGMSGGAKGVHVHWTVATSLAAARRYITGYVNYRNGRSVAAWGATMGLVDPWPLIEHEWTDEVARRDAAEAASAAAATAAALAAAEEEARRIAAAEAEAAARRKEDDMKTRKVRIGPDIFVSCVAEGLLWHVPNTKALPAADVMVDDPTAPPIELDAQAAKALFDAYADATSPEKIAKARDRAGV